MAVVWPDSLSYEIDRGSFSLTPSVDVARSEFDDGPQLTRMRFNNPTMLYTGTLTLDNAELAVFQSFYFSTLNQGARWFEMPIWDGAMYTLLKARFTERFEVRDDGWNQYKINIKLEVRKFTSYSAFATYLFELYGVDFSITEIADPLQIIVNVQYPGIFSQGNWPDYT